MSQPRFSRILIAVDGSERASHVLDVGLELARSSSSEVVVLRCVGLPTDVGHEFLGRTPEELEADLVEAASKATEALLRAAGAEGAVRVRIEVGIATPTILRVAEEEDVGLLVLGAHGYRWAERVLGTTVSRVVDRSSRSVLVVR